MSRSRLYAIGLSAVAPDAETFLFPFRFEKGLCSCGMDGGSAAAWPHEGVNSCENSTGGRNKDHRQCESKVKGVFALKPRTSLTLADFISRLCCFQFSFVAQALLV